MLRHCLFIRHVKTNPLRHDCFLDGAGIVEATLSEVPLKDSSAAGEDQQKKALAEPLSLLVIPEHSDYCSPTAGFLHI